MPAVLASLLGGLIQIAGTLAGRVLIGLGIGVVTYTGLSTSLDWLKAQALSSMAGLPADLLGLMSYLKVGVCINVITSAIAARAVIQGLTGDTLKKWVLK